MRLEFSSYEYIYFENIMVYLQGAKYSIYLHPTRQKNFVRLRPLPHRSGPIPQRCYQYIQTNSSRNSRVVGLGRKMSSASVHTLHLTIPHSLQVSVLLRPHGLSGQFRRQVFHVVHNAGRSRIPWPLAVALVFCRLGILGQRLASNLFLHVVVCHGIAR